MKRAHYPPIQSPGSCLPGRFWLGVEEFEPRHTDPESAVLPLDEPPLSGFNFITPDLPRQFSRPRGGFVIIIGTL